MLSDNVADNDDAIFKTHTHMDEDDTTDVDDATVTMNNRENDRTFFQ